MVSLTTSPVQLRSTDNAASAGRGSMRLETMLLVLSGILAPMGLRLSSMNFTAYDGMVVAIVVLLVAAGRRLQFMPLALSAAVHVFLLFALLSTFRAIQLEESLTQVLQYAFIFLVQIPIILTLARSLSTIRTCVVLFVAGWLTGLTAALVVGNVTGSGRALSLISDNPNQLGYPVAYTIPFVLWAMTAAWRSGRQRLLVIGGLPVLYVMAWALAASGSRRAILGTLIASIVFLAFRHGPKFNTRLVVRMCLSVAMVGLIGFAVIQTDYLPSTLRDRIDRTLLMEDSLTRDRTDLAMAGWLAFVESPLVGVGFDNFRYLSREYVPSASNQTPHNLWIQMLCQIGLAGTLAFLFLIVAWLALLWRAQKATPDRRERELLWAFIASMLAIMVQYMFGPIMIQREYWLIYGLGLALALCATRTATTQSPQFRSTTLTEPTQEGSQS